jgi:hypothetical protein
MKIILDQDEIRTLLKRSFPPEMIPDGYEVTEVESQGYPLKEFHISLHRSEVKAE